MGFMVMGWLCRVSLCMVYVGVGMLYIATIGVVEVDAGRGHH